MGHDLLMPGLFHVSEEGPFERMEPRPSPPGTPWSGRELVWAVDDEHLALYLVPRDCPRVCWASDGERNGLLASPVPRVVAVEAGWLPRIAATKLFVHRLDSHPFVVADAIAGYWVEHPARRCPGRDGGSGLPCGPDRARRRAARGA